jgi:hypothetical protein
MHARLALLFPAQRSGASACVGSARAAPPRVSHSAAAAPAPPDSPGGKRVPVGWDPADDHDVRSPRKSAAAEAAAAAAKAAAAPHSGAVPWWAARVEAPARHEHAAAAAEAEHAAAEASAEEHGGDAAARMHALGSSGGDVAPTGAVESAPAEWDTYAQARPSR